MITYTQEEKQALLTVLYPANRLRVSSPTPACPRAPFTVGCAFIERSKTLPTGEQWTSVIFICFKTMLHFWIFKL